MNLWTAKIINRLLALRYNRLKRKDVWFFEHYYCTGRHITTALRSAMDEKAVQDARVLEIGCGDGITALSVSKNTSEVHAVDLTRAFDGLSEKVSNVLQDSSLPTNLHFYQVKESDPLPFENESFDAIYSWSVFEHITDVPKVLDDAFRLLRTNGYCFIQIAPLYHSAFGSHLKRLGIQPWEHLKVSRETLAASLKARVNQINEREKDWLFENTSDDAFTDYLLSEFTQLNEITASELVHASKAAGFSIVHCQIGKEPFLKPDAELQQRFSKELLLEREIWLLLQKR